MKEDIQTDMHHLCALLDHCTDEDILQQIRKNIRAALNLVEVNIIEISSRFNRISNKPADKALSPQKNSSLTKITKLTNKQKHEL